MKDNLLRCEIVVYDDCSTDTAKAEANRQLCESLTHCRFVRGNHNVGRSAARNRLVEQWINVCGMALLLALMMFVTMQDVGRLL